MANMSEQDEILQIFLSEAEELVKLAEVSLISLESAPESMSDLEELFRSIHTLKSSAAMMGFESMSEYTHLLETLLDRLRSRKIIVTNRLITFLLESVDFIRSMVDRVSQGKPESDSLQLKKNEEQLKRYLGLEELSGAPEKDSSPKAGSPASEPPGDTKYFSIHLAFSKSIFYSGRDPLLVLLSLSELGELIRVSPDLSRLPAYEEMALYDLYISWHVVLKTTRSIEDVDDVFLFVKHDNDIQIEDITARFKQGVDLELADKKLGEVLVDWGTITPGDLGEALGKQKKLGEILVEDGKIEAEELREAMALHEESREVYRKTTIRVSVEKMDALVNLAEEMGIGLARMNALAGRFSGPQRSELEEEMEYLLKVNREFQDRVARVRMFPLEGTFRRFQRMVRDLAFKQGKLTQVIVKGLDTELDKEVIEHITDPMKHLVRNCIDHGIESPSERRAKGKPDEGVIEFRAYQREGKIYIEIRDDGRGVDLEAVRQKAFSEGWLKPDHEPGRETLLGLIFKPGFSLSPAVTELSGRGVGMDVVKTRIEQLGGTIDIDTELDKGTTVTLCLPLRFTLMDGLRVRLSDMECLIPLQAVVGTERFEKRLVKTMGAVGKVYLFRGDYLPLIELRNFFNLEPAPDIGDSGILVFLDTGRKTFGISVDEILEPQQIIIKSLETNYRSIKGISGAAIMGDGSVSLVLDLLGLEEMFLKQVV